MSDIDERPSKIRKVGLPTMHQLRAVQLPLIPILMSQHGSRNSHNHRYPHQSRLQATEQAHHRCNQPKPLSKSQIKKRKKQEEWEANKSKRAEFRRIKRKERQARKAAAQASGLLPPPPPSSSRRPIQVPVAFLIDCDFESYMMEKEIISLTAQVTRCYSDNRTALEGSEIFGRGVGGGGGDYGWAYEGAEGGKLVGALAKKNGLEEWKKPVKESKKLEDFGDRANRIYAT
ncbi:hypothetical protein DID88_001706 [Monilinia fructigena]|uniref:tRNA (guanine(9)-N1)-methyltransferase n=1 Tax=Monilinia fructigena TaxID=38457 RepID=A0A395IZ24_9HELO|nr:hypothetical protein DID88_001706 [Monilinia fructigena]